MHREHLTRLLRRTLLVAPIVVPHAAPAQIVTLAAGVAIPQGPMAIRRAGGGQLAVAIAPPHRVRGFTGRAEFTQSWFPRRNSFAQTLEGLGQGALNVRSVMGYLMYVSTPKRVSFHVGLGAGPCRMDIPGRPNPYHHLMEMGAIAGIKIGRGRVRADFEIQQLVLSTDYGNDDFKGSTFVPIRVGVTLQ
jgi:hypothetical protein